MKKKLTLWIFFLPVVLFAQTGISKDGVITLDLFKKKPATDTVQKQTPKEEEEDYLKPRKEKKQKPSAGEEDETPDFKRDGLFKGLFHAGINGCQVDGDQYWGFKYPGFDGGVGAMIRFHKFMSVSMELNYTMKGARQTFFPQSSDSTRQKFMIQWDYIEVPLSLNFHDKKLVMFSLGVAPAIMVRYKERDENGNDVTNNPPFMVGQPRRFDLTAFGMFNFVIQKHFAVGLKYAYSTVPIRDAYPLSRLRNQYNQVITLRFTYILDAVKKKK